MRRRVLVVVVGLLGTARQVQASISVFEMSGSFVVPIGVTSIDVMAIGGGGAGSGSHYTAGGSGYLNVETFLVSPGAIYTITVGAGGLSDGVIGNASIGGSGGASSFDALLVALGGTGGGPVQLQPDTGNGGSGGGGAGNSGSGGNGGSGGANGEPGYRYLGGIGQGPSEWLELSIFSDVVLSAGLGGLPSTGSHQGGGGGGGVLVDGFGVGGDDANGFGHNGGKGGQGYGAGGGSSGFDLHNGGQHGIGGSGAAGLVVVEWLAVPEPTTFLANPGFEIPETTATGQFPTTFGDWAGDISEIVTAQNGIIPAEGDQMLHFLNTSPVGPAFPGTSSDVWQLVDVSSLATDITSGRVVIEVSALFNRIAGDLESDTAFRIKIDALDGVPADFFDKKVAGSELATSVSEIITDGEFWTWEMADTSLLLPAGTEYIAIMVNAVENTVNDGVAPEFDGHYADDVVLTVNLVEPSDLNGDGLVDASDAGVMFGNWGPTTLGYFDGNLNGDGFIDAADAGIMFGNWTGDVGPAAIIIPEPTTFTLTAIALCLVATRRRRTKQGR